MATAIDYLETVRMKDVSAQCYSSADGKAWAPISCPSCGASQMVVIAREVHRAVGQRLVGFKPDEEIQTLWLRCPACLRGAVREGSLVYPAQRPLRTPKGLPPVDLATWEEVRTCLGVGAHVATVMLCRKLLFHVAVSHGLEPANERGRAPGFAEAVAHLLEQGVISAAMRPWVDRVKDIGNEANHELEPISADEALRVAKFTEQLLILAYEHAAELAEIDPEAVEDEGEIATEDE